MTNEKALDLLNQIRLKIEMNGHDHDLARQAYEKLLALVQDQNVADKTKTS